MKIRVAISLTCVGAALAWALLAFLGQIPWPFPARPSLVVLEDPDLRRAVSIAALTIAGGLLAAALGLVFRRLLVPGVLVLAVTIVYAAPHLRTLLVEAYPTSYYASPTGFASASIVHGRALFGAACVACHGVEGRGDGPLSRSLADPPADLTAAHLWDHADGELFWWLTHGIEAPEGGLAMPGFADQLSVADRWDMIDYVRAHNAGAAMRASGGWSHPVAVPGFAARCGTTTVTSGDLHGRVVRLVVAGGEERPVPLPADRKGVHIVDVYAPAKPDGAPGCVADAPEFVAALAVVTGQAPDVMAGTQFLVDPDGYLRARHRPDAPDGWNSMGTLLAQVGQICTHPVAAQGGNSAQAQ